MAAAQRLKASDKQAVCKKLVTALKKRYKGSVPKNNRDVLHSMLFSVCLEENSYEAAEQLYESLLDSFHDLNEIRVSSITELEAVFNGSPISEWRALRTRSLLFHVFEENFEYEYEGVRRKTQEQATKVLKKVKDISPFMVLQTLQFVLGSHVLPLDQRMLNVVSWMGFVEPGCSIDDASDQLKPVVRKSDVTQFCYLIRCLAMDPKLYEVILADIEDPPEDGFDLRAVESRLEEAAKGGRPRPKKSVAKSAPPVESAKPTKKKTTGRSKAGADKAAPAKSPAKKKTKSSSSSTPAKKQASSGKAKVSKKAATEKTKTSSSAARKKTTKSSAGKQSAARKKTTRKKSGK